MVRCAVAACAPLRAQPLPPACQGEFSEVRVTFALPADVRRQLELPTRDGPALARFALAAVNSDCVIVALAPVQPGQPYRSEVFIHGAAGWTPELVESQLPRRAPDSKAELLAAFR
jgi:hypothetical protein